MARIRRDPLVTAFLVLTMLSGFIDAISFLALGHVFTANMTGNVVLLGFAAAGAPGFSAAASGASLAAFVVGAAGAGRMSAVLGSRRTLTLLALAAEAALLAMAAVAAALLEVSGPGRYPVIMLMAVAMGIRNAVSRRLDVPGVRRTTVLTTTLTGLAADFGSGTGTPPGAAVRAASVALMLLGACLGAVLLRHVGSSWLLLVTSVCVGLTAVGFAVHPGSRRAVSEGGGV